MKYYIIAGEASGDLHGSNLMKAILRSDPQAEIRFWGGDLMQSVGGTLVKHIRDLAFMGFVEVVANLRTVLKNIALCKKDIVDFHPDAVIFIDYPGFNLKIAKFTHAQGFKNFYYISPQVWAWKKGRIKTMRKVLDMMYVILPFEKPFYDRNNVQNVEFVGHPLLDAIAEFDKNALLADDFRSRNGLDERPIIALMPGSRKMELRKMMPNMCQLAAQHSEYQFVIAGMKLLGSSMYTPYIHSDNVSIVYDQTYPLLKTAFAGVITSGTATLEAALFDLPLVVCYKANALSVFIAKRFAKVNYISLVNLIADKPVVKELIQNDLNANDLESEFRKITVDESYRQNLQHEYDLLKEQLGGVGASQRTVNSILAFLNNTADD
ncbi:MAG: lipid-A-disaccharide synthase [Bacteroidales bacterium]|nr:lipid-A-disaccharide synthase [Bacteroidales bacterium]